jgi:gamma-glutamyltranspeptidase/glutathione hydrolase
MRVTPLLLAGCVLLCGCAGSTPPPIHAGDTVSGRAVVVCVSEAASQVGARVLARGGNAVDAAVATAFALAVTFPDAGNIGGGGFMLVQPPAGADPLFIDYRETAPAAVDANTFARKADRTEYRLAGVPGTVRGLALAHEKFGKLPWRDLVEPAVGLARDGYTLDKDQADALNRVLAAHKDRSELQRVYGKPDGSAWQPGDVLRQADLAQTLALIRDGGADGFYTGPVADQIVAEMRRGGGLIGHADLAGYRARVRTPIRGTFRGYEIVSAPPPSSGGIALVEMLNILDRLNIARWPRLAPETIHLTAEAMRRAYADRARHLGDPDFVLVPADLMSPEHAGRLAATIDPRKATPSESLASGIALRDEPENTTHFSVIDADGMAVSNTYTLEESFGGKIVVAGAGFLLNNELGDFNPQPGVTTRGGQIGTAANLAGPGKRPLSSMTPTIVRKDGRVVLVTGSPGGRTIINTVACVLVNRLVYQMSPRECVDAPRHHHQWLPDRIQLEPALHVDATVTEALRAIGHTIDPTPRRQGDAHSIFYDPATNGYVGVADHRRSGSAAGY